MDKEKIIVIGAGGHSRSVLDILLANDEYDIYGLLDNDKNAVGLYGIPILGSDALFKDIYMQGVRKAFVAIGNNDLRKKNFMALKVIGFDFINAISRNAYVSERSAIGKGIAVMHGAVVNAGTRIGDGVIINTCASVDHDCEISDFTHIAPGATLCGGIKTGGGAFICAGAKIIQYLEIGEKSIVAAGAVVIKSVPDNTVVAGVPASAIKYN